MLLFGKVVSVQECFVEVQCFCVVDQLLENGKCVPYPTRIGQVVYRHIICFIVNSGGNTLFPVFMEILNLVLTWAN